MSQNGSKSDLKKRIFDVRYSSKRRRLGDAGRGRPRGPLPKFPDWVSPDFYGQTKASKFWLVAAAP